MKGLAVAVFTCGLAVASTQAWAIKHGDPVAGAKKAQTCFACHGKGGHSTNAMYPILAGQYADYIIRALHDYKDGIRQNPIMRGMAGSLSDKDIQDLAAYFSSQPTTLYTLKR